ncbi:Uncharacterised protein [Mammaliicoccus lentus]|uniref:hypothetical protein n=1 Tax=Mammaliicoccus lentus TaxID=42858 RepID=UPI000868A94C|nr:hypothetical protein [Mammaliicoccus lentus]SCU51919.1 Uncharacterised protein [Mammaliicoccus lentus]
MNDRSNKKQIEWEKNGGISPDKGEYRNQERGTSTSLTPQQVQKLIEKSKKK